jgi:hypothetical protein
VVGAPAAPITYHYRMLALFNSSSIDMFRRLSRRLKLFIHNRQRLPYSELPEA